MHLLYYIQNSLIGMILVVIIMFNFMSQRGRRQVEDSLFFFLLLNNFLLLFFELSIDLLTGRVFLLSRPLLMSITLCFYILNPLPGAIYILYLDQLIHKWEKIPQFIGFVSFFPFILNALFSFMSLFNGFTFYVDASNTYHRGDFFFLMVACNFIYLLISPIYIYRRRKSFQKRAYSILLFFPFPVMIAGIIQIFVFGLELLWSFLALSLLIVYLNIQNSKVSKDYLTGLFNRRRFEQYLDFLIKEKHPRLIVGGILMDINGFKKINDTYGHDFGDLVLHDFAQLLLTSFPRRYLIARYGGDEFALLMELSHEKELEQSIQSFENDLSAFNEKKNFPFELSVCMGFAVFDKQVSKTPEEFVKLLDRKMYDKKRALYSTPAQILFPDDQ